MHLTNKPLKAKQIDSIEIWTDAFINNANVMIDRHPLLAGYVLSYMSIIRGAVVDAAFYRATTKNFDLALHTIKPEHGLKLMTIDGYNLSPKVVEARQQLSFQFLLQSHLMILISK
jgi:hypothetical protein